MLKSCFLFLLAGVFFFSCSDNPAESEKTGTITGKVTDSQDGSAINDANITTDPATTTAMTNAVGDYEITEVNPGTYSVSASKTGYIPNSVNIEVTIGNSATADIALSSSSPTASFDAYPLTGNSSTIFKFDATGSNDNQDPLAALQIRWDWENDEVWDTEYSTTKTVTHQYASEGTYIVKMEVKNNSSLTDNTTNQVTVYPYETGTLTDIDGNTYITVLIGDQWWMAENLKVTHYRNEDAIPNVTNDADWVNLTSGAYCNVDDDESNAEVFGCLYNWHAVYDIRNIAPDGWHVPTDAEWIELEMYLGMSQAEADVEDDYRGTDEGNKLKEVGTKHWLTSNAGVTNESGFSALPAGSRDYIDGSFYHTYYDAYFWTSTAVYGSNAWSRVLYHDSSKIYRGGSSWAYKRHGFSVRCVKD